MKFGEQTFLIYLKVTCGIKSKLVNINLEEENQ